MTNDCPGPVENVLKSVAHQSILQFDISSIRSFLKREKITQCNAFSLCVASFFITLFICCKSYLMNRSQNAEQRSPVHTNTQNGCRKLRSHPFPPRTPALTVLYMICVHLARNDRIFVDLTSYTFHTMDSRGFLLLIKLSILRHLQHDHFDTVSCFA